MNKPAKTIIRALVVLVVIISALFLVHVHLSRPVPVILMYHSIADRGGGTDPLIIEKKLFARQMKHLSAHGYEPVLLSRVVQSHKEGEKIPSNWIVLTFDDGKANFYSAAYPLLKAHGFKADLFVSPARLETTAEFLTWGQLKGINEGGLVEIGSHGLDHYPLTSLPPLEADERIRRSRALLEEQLGTKIALFAYPYGAFNRQLREMVVKAGYEGAAGTAYPRGKFMAGDIYNMRRVFVSPFSAYPLVFRFMLSGYYVPTRELFLKLLAIDTPRDVLEWNQSTNPAF